MFVEPCKVVRVCNAVGATRLHHGWVVSLGFEVLAQVMHVTNVDVPVAIGNGDLFRDNLARLLMIDIDG